MIEIDSSTRIYDPGREPSPYGDLSWTPSSTTKAALGATSLRTRDDTGGIIVKLRRDGRLLVARENQPADSRSANSDSRVANTTETVFSRHTHWLVRDLIDVSASIDDWLEHYQLQELVNGEVRRLFSQAAYMDLEPGMDNSFSIGLEQVVEKYGNEALDVVIQIILSAETSSSIAMEALKYIGDSDSSKWHDERRLVLEECLLKSRSAWVRDGAGLGLSSLDDPRSLPAVKLAFSQESSSALKEDLLLVLDQLERKSSEL